MALPSSTKLGTYEIAALIGAGGMGEVEARFRRLSRQPKSRVKRGISPSV